MSLLDTARALLASGPLCDACLGRPLADLSHGLSNAERGRALRVAVAMADDEPFEPPDECWVCGCRTAEFDAWARRAADALDGVEFDTYLVGSRPPATVVENGTYLRAEAGLDGDAGETFRSECNREVGKRLGDLTGTTADLERPDVAVLLDFGRDAVEVQVNPAFVYGRYRKLERGVAQVTRDCPACGGRGSVWREGEAQPCEECGGTGRQTPESVEGFVAPAVRGAMDGEGAVFHAAGREYPDVRMLGTGRPFVVEVKAPRRRSPHLDAVAAGVAERSGGAVEVADLAVARHGIVEHVTRTPFAQRFRLSVAFDGPVDADAFADAVAALDGATVRQRGATGETEADETGTGRAGAGEDETGPAEASEGETGPAEAGEAGGETETDEAGETGDVGRERVRTLSDVEGSLSDDRRGTLEVTVEAGLDVAALVTGDDGRTEPSLAGLLGVGASVESLDVVAVESEGGPFAPPELLRDGG